MCFFFLTLETFWAWFWSNGGHPCGFAWCSLWKLPNDEFDVRVRAKPPSLPSLWEIENMAYPKSPSSSKRETLTSKTMQFFSNIPLECYQWIMLLSGVAVGDVGAWQLPRPAHPNAWLKRWWNDYSILAGHWCGEGSPWGVASKSHVWVFFKSAYLRFLDWVWDNNILGDFGWILVVIAKVSLEIRQTNHLCLATSVSFG